MASNVTQTMGAIGGATAAAIVGVWWYDGAPKPVPQEVTMSLSVLLGIAAHSVVMVAYWAAGLVNQLVSAYSSQIAQGKVTYQDISKVLPKTGLDIPVPGTANTAAPVAQTAPATVSQTILPNG